MRSNHLNLGMRCIKYMLIIINVLFVLTSTLLLTVGGAIQTLYNDFNHFLDDNFLSVPALMVAIGIIMLLVAVFGVIGALKESTMLTNIYGVLLTIVFILEVSAALAAFLLPGQVESMLTRTMTQAIQNYNKLPIGQEAVDFMQEKVECCGVNGPEDWEGVFVPPLDNEVEDGYMNLTVPRSCCQFIEYGGQSCQSYENGCLNRMKFLISQSAIIVATGATTVAFVQILGVFCAFMLAKSIRRTKSLRAARTWQLQQSLGILPTNDTKPSYEEYTQLEKNELQSEQPIVQHYK